MIPGFANILPVLLATPPLNPVEETGLEWWLAVIIGVVVALLVCLLGFALAYRRIARRATRPCPSCMEFIPKKATVCPRCGKAV